MADQPYDPYIPNNGAAGSAQAGAPGNQRTAAIQQVGSQLLIFFLSLSGRRAMEAMFELFGSPLTPSVTGRESICNTTGFLRRHRWACVLASFDQLCVCSQRCSVR
jgi:hypothetical protein